MLILNMLEHIQVTKREKVLVKNHLTRFRNLKYYKKLLKQSRTLYLIKCKSANKNIYSLYAQAEKQDRLILITESSYPAHVSVDSLTQRLLVDSWNELLSAFDYESNEIQDASSFILAHFDNRACLLECWSRV